MTFHCTSLSKIIHFLAVVSLIHSFIPLCSMKSSSGFYSCFKLSRHKACLCVLVFVPGANRHLQFIWGSALFSVLSAQSHTQFEAGREQERALHSLARQGIICMILYEIMKSEIKMVVGVHSCNIKPDMNFHGFMKLPLIVVCLWNSVALDS